MRNRHANGTGPTARLGERAVVLGASMSGLLAARVLSDFYGQVMVVERDVLDGDGRPRRGVPQGRHAHVLLPRGAKILGELFPGLLSELVEAGVPTPSSLSQFHFRFNDHLLSQQDVEGETMYGASRPFLESRVKARVAAMPNVTLLDGFEVTDLLHRRTEQRVAGVRVTRRKAAQVEGDMDADLVVVATGRSGRVSNWLAAMGYPVPEDDELRVDIMYASQHRRFVPPGAPRLGAVLVGPTADRPFGMGAFQQENGVWVVTLAGFRGHHPPTDQDAWLEFADRVGPRDFITAIRRSEPVDDIQTHRFPADLRRRYDKLDEFPDGLLVIGDAQCSFNPIYGQGMTVAALEALALGDTLRSGTHSLARRFFRASAKPIGDAWQFATGADLALPASVVPGARPLPLRAVNAYIDRYQSAAQHDPVLAWQFLRVTGFDEPVRTLFGPASIGRIVAQRVRHREGRPLGREEPTPVG